MRKILLGVLAGLLPGFVFGQTSPFVDEKVERALLNELSGDLAFETLRITTQWHKPSGSEGFFAVAREVEARAKAAGLADVRWIDQVAEHINWTCRRGEAWLLEGTGPSARETKIASYADVAVSVADNSRPASVTAEIVDVGSGETTAAYAGKDVRGKIVLAYGGVGAVMEQAVWKRGALGILSWSSSRLNHLADSADQVGWVSVPEKDGPNGEKTTFAIVISAREGKSLADRMSGEGSRRWGAAGGGESAAAPCDCAWTSTPSFSRRRRRPWWRPGSREPTRLCRRSCSPRISRRRSSRPTTTSPGSPACSRSGGRSRA